MTNKSAKSGSLSLFAFFALVCERIFIKTHNIEIRFVIEPQNYAFSQHVCALFSLEILLAWAVKGLMQDRKKASVALVTPF